MTDRVLIAGGGICGLSLGLTLHQIGVPFTVYETVEQLKPLGVGINLQPNAVRELMDLAFSDADFARFGVPSKEWALVGLEGQDIYAEPRGTEAGYHWPQIAAHRGRFHLALYERLEQLAPGSVRLGHRATGYEANADGSVTLRLHTPNGEIQEAGKVLIAADGIHSALRQQMHPDQPPIHWGGAMLWRGTTQARPVRTGSSFIGLGTEKQRMVIYPISAPDPVTGLAEINWIAEVTHDAPPARDTDAWFREVPIESFVHHFADWRYDWLDVPALIRGADRAFENPMIDRDPCDTWVDGPVILLGDAAHPMYPTGSNGASQAIMDARLLGAKFLEHGVGGDALAALNAEQHGPISELVLRNRGDGPFGLLRLLNERCGGQFDNIDDTIPAAERAAFMAKYKSAAGFARDTLNTDPPTIPDGAKLGAATN